jgi:acyl transferase domain-containing protein/predicted amino acid dehydrogenase/short-subunit dehydrogenase
MEGGTNMSSRVPNKEPIAIVGMACRFPGRVNDPAAFWELLRGGVDAITEVPPERWNASRFYHPNAAAPGRMVSRWGGFVDNVNAFDAAFFGIAPREAARIDPQQRWLAEVAWEAIEDAGLPVEQLAGTRTGVFVGISHSDYPMLHRNDIRAIDGYSNIGSALSIAANRLSYLFNLRGPSFAVDTACSSGLVALHLAARSLASGECDYAIVGGTNALLNPGSSVGFSQAHMLSPRGRCRAFDAGADGYVRAEGAAAILLMPLQTAQDLGLEARALLIATASNQDGHSSGLTVPNQQAQEEMIREALQSAGADARDVVYVEAHGTGTPVGDPIEARALAAVLSDGRAPAEKLLIGSVKTNIGHLESASGLAGLIKAVLVLEQGAIPPNLHFDKPNSLLPTDRVTVPTALTPLPILPGRNPLVAVNSFGFGGTNAHALLAPAPAFDPVVAVDEPCIFPLSARNPTSLASYAGAFAKFIAEDVPSSFSLGDLCAATARGKSHHPLRHAFVADSLASLQTQLLSLKEAPSPAATARPKIAFVFSGQGPQWWAMGRQLYEREKVVRDVWEQCDALCRKLGGLHLLDALLADEATSRVNYTEVAQPALFALQAGLVELWRAWGIEADAVIGHSIGEAAAAWAAGIFDLEGIFRVILARSRWQAKTHGLGRMLAAAISADDAAGWEQKFAGRVSIAALNAPRQVTLSGDASALEEIATTLQEAEIFCRFLQTEYAFHSAQMDSLADGLRQDLQGVVGGAARVPMISTVTGEPVRAREMDGDYWWRNVRHPVRFAAGIERLIHDGCTAFVEFGPHPVMAAALTEIALAQKSSALSVASLRRGENERSTMLRGFAALYRSGASVRWEALYTRPTRALRLPAYPWQRQRLWHEDVKTAHELRSPPSHPLLGDRQAHPQPTWMGHFDARLLPWLADHQIAGSAVVPAAAYLEMACAAVRELLGEPNIVLEGVKFHHLLFLPDERPVPTCVRLDPASASFQIFAAQSDTLTKWEVQAEGTYRSGRWHVPPRADLDLLRKECAEDVDRRALYRELSEMGQVYGPTFQNLISLRLRKDEAALAEVGIFAEPEWPDYVLFPPELDSCFQSSFALRHLRDRSAVIIVSLQELRIFQPLPAKIWSYLRLVDHGENTHVGDLTIYDSTGAVVAQLDALKLRAIDSESKRGRRERKFYGLAWDLAPASAAANQESAAEPVLIFSDREEFGVSLAESLRRQQITATVVFCDAARGSRQNSGAHTVNLRQRDWATQLWKTLAARGPLPARILYFWGWGDGDGCSAFLALTQARLTFPGSGDPARWLVVTHRAQAVHETDSINPEPAALWGFARSVQTELPQWHLSLVDCGDASSGAELLRELFAEEIEPEVALRDDGRRVRRMRNFQPKSSPQTSSPPAYFLHIERPGRVDSLQFRGRARCASGAGEVEIEVAAAGLNFRDVMKALGIYPLKEGEPSQLGDEFAGRIFRVGRGVRKLRVGDRVMGFAPMGGAFGSHLILHSDAVWRISTQLGFAEAASIPVVFGTAYHALQTLARLRPGETVLIHAAAGGVGLAAVQLAQKIGAVVLATAGSEEKREYLRSLGIALVMDSRTLDFAGETLRYTAGRGVDVVLNSLAGAFQQKSLAVCAAHGRFVEIGKRDLFEGNALPLAAFQRSLSFFAFDLTSVLASNGVEQRALRRFLTRGFAEGKLTPIPSTTVAASDAVSAFRRMQAAQHIGKIVLEFDPDRVPEVPAEFWPNPDGTYLITGGLSGFGLATAEWLVERGAMNLALLSRRGMPSTQDAPIIEAMRARGVSVFLIAADVADGKALAAALRKLKRKAAPLRGVFHSAMVLRDRFLAEMTQEDLALVLAPKIAGSWNLHLLTRDLPLDCFVMFSSISAVIGAPGHANYAGANAFLDALAHHRRAAGLPALSINWGQLADVGVAAERARVGRYLDGIGVLALSSRDALASLARLIASGEAQVGVMDVDWDKLNRASTKFSQSPVFGELVQFGKTGAANGQTASDWREAVLQLSPEEQVAAVSDLVVAQVAATLGMAPASIDRSGPLTGMDSLMAVELKVRIETHAGCELPINLFNADLTAAGVAERLLKQLAKATAETKPTMPAAAEQAGSGGRFVVPFLREEAVPLVDLLRSGKLEPLAAAALMSWPDTLFEQRQISPQDFFQRMNGGRVSFDLIIETPLGSVGIFMLPLTTAQVTPGETSLLRHVLDGIAIASASGARCVALTGLIPSATHYATTVQAACEGRNGLAPATTGHATTVAAVILNLEALLTQAEREIRDEAVMFYGVGSIGLGALRLMLDVLPHPAELRLCDPFRSAEFFAELAETLREEHAYRGPIRIVASGVDAREEFYDATVIVGATNVENALDVGRLAPGTLIVDDSSPHCMKAATALARLAGAHDILFTEGGFVRSSAPMPRVAHVPTSIASAIPAEIPQLFFSMFNPHEITGCVLSALISARRPELPPTIGLITREAAREHWMVLKELGFTAAELNYEGTALPLDAVAIFREQFGRAARAESRVGAGV